jgi:acyl carrier protein
MPELQSEGRSCQTGNVPESRTAKLRALIQKVSGKPAPADEEESLFESGLLDSFALPDLVSAIEEAFSIKVPDADLNPRKFDSIARIEAYLDSK